MLMSKIAGGRRQGGSLGASDIAATLGLLAVAFMVDRVAPTKDAKLGLQPKESGHASPARLVAESESGDRGRDAASPSDIPANGWKDILWRVYSNISDTAFSLSPPA